MSSVVPSPLLLNAQLASEKVALEERLREQAAESRELRQENASLLDQVRALKESERELTAHLKRLLGGRGSLAATIAPGQGILFGENLDELTQAIEDLGSPEEDPAPELSAEDLEVPDAEEASQKRSKLKADRTRRKVDESNLRREVRRSELPPEDRRCPDTGVELVEVDVKVTEELDYRRAELVMIEHQQVIYGPAPEVAKERKIKLLPAPPPSHAVEGVVATAALLAWLISQKYVLHLPLYRQEDAFARLGVRLSRKTLCDWVMKSAFALRPVAVAIEGQIRAGPVLQIDDTPIKVKRVGPGGGKAKLKQSYLWVMKNPAVRGVVFRFTVGRAMEDVAAVLRTSQNEDPVEVLIGDGYEGCHRPGYQDHHEFGHSGPPPARPSRTARDRLNGTTWFGQAGPPEKPGTALPGPVLR